MSGRNKPPRDSESFADKVCDVTPLNDRDKIRAPGGTPRKAMPRMNDTASKRDFFVERESLADGEAVFARATDLSRGKLLELRTGKIAPDREVDLHGLRSEDARQRLRATLDTAHQAGERCVLVIHGRGRHSEDGPVLRDAVPQWCLEPPLANQLLALASAPRALGGPGATLLLVRRKRRR